MRLVTPSSLVAALLLSSPPAGALARRSAGLDALPPEVSAGLTARIQRAEYEATWVEKTPLVGVSQAYQAPNRAQDFRTYFTAYGPTLVPREAQDVGWQLGMTLVGYGQEGRIQPVLAALPVGQRERVELRRGPIVEWYVNRPDGLEQGFTLLAPPALDDAGVVLELALSGGFEARLDGDDPSALELRHETSGACVRYAGLVAWDADGRARAARIEALGQRVRVHVDVSGARWPVTVDPSFTIPSRLRAAVLPAAGDNLGSSVALDKDTAVVGVPSYDGAAANSGAVFVFRRSGQEWVQEQRLVGSSAAIDDWFGYSVAVSASTIVVGAPLDNTVAADAGVAYVFVRGGTTWTQQAVLSPTDGSASSADQFGFAVGLSGEAAVVGALYDDSLAADAGSAYVFVRSGTSWSQQQRLNAVGGATTDIFGRAVAISGETLVAAATQADLPAGGNAGAAYVFVRSGTTWAQQQKLSASDAAGGDAYGRSVSIDGNTLAVGAYLAGGTDAGKAYVYSRSGTTWSEQAKWTGATAGDRLGVAVSVAGDTAVVGAYLGDAACADCGYARVFRRSGAVWSEPPDQFMLVEANPSADSFGYALAAWGDFVLVGAYGWNGGRGETLLFRRKGSEWTRRRLDIEAPAVGHQWVGGALAGSADTLVVGAEGNGTIAGAVWVFTRDGIGWRETQTLTGTTSFGSSVALSGTTLAVGDPDGNGSVAVYASSGGVWTLQQQIDGSGGNFGSSLGLSGSTLVVGARGDDSAGTDAGAVYVYVRSGTTWSLQQTLTAPNAAAFDRFGQSVAVDGNSAAIGTPGDGTLAGAGAGTVRVFVRSGTVWSEQATLSASDAAAGDTLGSSVAIQGDTLVAGAPGADYGVNPNFGAAYAFGRVGTAWSQQKKLTTAPLGAANQRLGESVALSGGLAVAGIPYVTTAGWAEAGQAAVFERTGTTWTLLAKLQSPAPQGYGWFGEAVALAGTTVVAGARLEDVGTATEAGAAYAFRAFTKGDVNGDGQTDLLLRHLTDGSNSAWLMNGTTRTGESALTPTPATLDWEIAGSDDFTADGINDLLVWNDTTGALEQWAMNGPGRIGAPVPVAGALAPPWKPSATADFDKDGEPDVVYRNFSTQKIEIWKMVGSQRVGTLVPNPDHAADANWEIVGAQDWNADGNTDFLWYNPNSGKIVLWFMNANVVRIVGQFTNPPNAGDNNWKVLAMGDYGVGPGGLGGTKDIVWRNGTSGRYVCWHMDQAGSRTYGTFTSPNSPTNALEWTIVGPR